MKPFIPEFFLKKINWMCCASLLMLSIISCSQVATTKEHVEYYYSQKDINRLINLWENPSSVYLTKGWKKENHMSIMPNGNIKYTDDVRKNCTVIWEVYPSGVIAGYELKGKGCD